MTYAVEIERDESAKGLELRLTGRLDEYGAQHLDAALDGALAGGARRLRLDLRGISYISSSGIGVLVRYQQRLKQLGGACSLCAASPQVRRVLEMARLGALLEPEAETSVPASPAPGASPPEVHLEPPRLQVETLAPDATLCLRAAGNPDFLAGRLFKEKDVRPLRPPESGFALGLGAFGRDFQACRHRFGEFLAVAGAAAYQPCDGSNVPDQLPEASELLTVYSLICEGSFSHWARFEASRPGAAVSLGDLVASCFDAAGAADWLGLVVLAEAPGAVPLLALAAGIAARSPSPQVTALLRPTGWPRYPAGRFHAARFERALPAVTADFASCCRTVFDSGCLRDVIVPRPDLTHFTRGACWIAPISKIER